MKIILSCFFAVLMLCPMFSALADVSPRTGEDYTPPLKDLAEAAGFKIGICLSPNQLSDTRYLDLLAAQFNTTTCTNETKAYSLLDQQASRQSEDGMPRMNYAVADRMVGWARDHGVGVRGHVLTWDAYMTEWFFHEDYDVSKPVASREVLLARMESYITQVITHFETEFPGVIYCWDVVNEAMGDSAAEYRAGIPACCAPPGTASPMSSMPMWGRTMWNIPSSMPATRRRPWGRISGCSIMISTCFIRPSGRRPGRWWRKSIPLRRMKTVHRAS